MTAASPPIAFEALSFPKEKTGQEASTTMRRRRHRNRALVVQLGSYALGAFVLGLFAAAGNISSNLPIIFFACGFANVAFFTALVRSSISDRIPDHQMVLAQVIVDLLIQAGMVIVAPQIGYAFLGVIILIFSGGSLHMTMRQALTACLVFGALIVPVFLNYPLGIPMTTTLERAAAALAFFFTLVQCVLVSLYANILRQKLRRKGAELRKAYARIEELAEIDDLTGALNRRFIMRSLGDEIIRGLRSRTSCAVALIDLDLFKQINDRFGHPAGDEVLRSFAIAVGAHIRGTDRFGRYGGEEFLLILPDTAPETAAAVLDRIRLVVAGLDWSGISPSLTVTISGGIAMLAPGETSETLLAQADRALYIAKRDGRNRIIMTA